MALENWEIPVDVYSSFGNFPSTGTENLIYIDESTGAGSDTVDAFVWKEDSVGYNFIGRVPKPQT